MAISRKTELVVERRYDPRCSRHSINGSTFVLHCHHYLSLYTQLAEDCAMLDAKKLLAGVAEDAAHELLESYYRQHGVEDIAARLAIGEQHYAFMGLGAMKVLAAGPDTAGVELLHSHIDAGWVHKWGKRDEPVNHITRGYIAALLSAANRMPPRQWLVKETASIVSGAERSMFVASRV